MPRNFDDARAERAARDADERTFVLGGETFTIRAAVRPEVLAAATRITPDSTVDADIGALDEMVVGFLEPDGHDRYRQLREREDDPVTYGDLLDLREFMTEVSARRPTQPPSPSGAGQARTGEPSTGESDSPAAKDSTT